jgi:hypothetical protein
MTDEKRPPIGQAPVDTATTARHGRPSPVETDTQSAVDPYNARKNRRHENLPKDTIPSDTSAPDEPTPKRGIEPDTIRNFPRADATPDSVMPVGVSQPPMKSLRGIAIAVAIVAAVLLVLVVAVGRGAPPHDSAQASAASPSVAASMSERATAPVGVTAQPTPPSAPHVVNTPPDREPPVAASPASAQRTSSRLPAGYRPPSRPKSRPPVLEPHHAPAESVAPPSQKSNQDPFEKPFFPPAK